MKTAIITGITGQLGSVLAEKMLNQNYKVYGIIRRASTFNTERIDHVFDKLNLVYGDLADYGSIVNLVGDVVPDVFINAGAMSHVKCSFDLPEYSLDINATGTMRCLEAIRRFSPKTKFIQLSTSEIFGNSPAPQNEDTRIDPRSPYAVAKAAAFYATKNYREAYGLFASNAICFNMEGPSRGMTFVTRKITLAAARIKFGLQDNLYLGNLDSCRDFNHIDDSSNAILLMANHNKADDFVIGTGQTHSIKEFLSLAFNKVGLNWEEYVKFDKKYLRPTEVDYLLSDPSKAIKELNWHPEKSFDDLVSEMIENDLKIAEDELILKNNKK